MIKTLNIKGKKYPLNFGILCLIELEESAGISVTNIQDAMRTKPISTIVNLLYYGFQFGWQASKKKGESPTRIEIASLIENNPNLGAQIIEVFTDSIPLATDSEEGNEGE